MPSVRSKSLVIEIWMMLILVMVQVTILMSMVMILMMIMMTKPYDYDDDTDDNDHKNNSYTAAGAALGASVPCSLFWFLRSSFFVLVPSSRFLRPGFFMPGSALT